MGTLHVSVDCSSHEREPDARLPLSGKPGIPTHAGTLLGPRRIMVSCSTMRARGYWDDELCTILLLSVGSARSGNAL